MDKRASDAPESPALTTTMVEVTRLCPERSLPLRAFVPGRGLPHPRHDEDKPVPAVGDRKGADLDVDTLWPHAAFRFGIDLFNHGYYWEAHEAWEETWHAAGRTGLASVVLKGLIKLAAAALKSRQGSAEGLQRHALAAKAHFAEVHRVRGDRVAHLDLQKLGWMADLLAKRTGVEEGKPDRFGDRPLVVMRERIVPAIPKSSSA